MNISSVAMGVLAGVSIAFAFYRAFRIAPYWTALTFVAMPLFVINFSYGNEVAWSMAFFFLSLALLTIDRRGWHSAAGVAIAASLFCRADVVLLAPYWLAWAFLFAHTAADEPWFKRILPPTIAFIVTALALFVLLVRQLPLSVVSFTWAFNPKLIVAYLSYPFNFSVVALGAIGWLLLLRYHRAYAWAHLLLLFPFLFYVRNLSSPKYIICFLLLYGLPTAFLLARASKPWRALALTAMAVWFFVAVSIYGVFGPKSASLWYLPTVDGACPIGGYLDFYARARSGGYQFKQVSHINEMLDFVDFAKSATSRYWIAGPWPNNTFPLVKARGELGTPEQQSRIEAIINEPGSRGPDQPNDGAKPLMFRSGYTDLGSIDEDLAAKIRSWLSKGQVRAQGPRAAGPLPTLIEVGDQIPEGADTTLGKRLLFVIDYYSGHMIFEQPTFHAPYRATSWLPASSTSAPTGIEPIYRDEQFVAYDQPVDGAKNYGYVWPAPYFQMKSPKPKWHGK
jgi:hypothetical protein